LDASRRSAGVRRRRLEAQRQVVEAYDAILRRWPDPTGLNHFSRLAMDGTIDRATLMSDLYTSDEARARISHEAVPADPKERMIALSGIFAAAEDGRLEAIYTDEKDAARIGHIANEILSEDLGPTLVAYFDELGTLSK